MRQALTQRRKGSKLWAFRERRTPVPRSAKMPATRCLQNPGQASHPRRLQRRARAEINVKASEGDQFASNRCPPPGGLNRTFDGASYSAHLPRMGRVASLPSFSSVPRFVCTRHPGTNGNEVNKDWSNSLVHISARDIPPWSGVSRRSRGAFQIAAGGVFFVGVEHGP